MKHWVLIPSRSGGACAVLYRPQRPRTGSVASTFRREYLFSAPRPLWDLSIVPWLLVQLVKPKKHLRLILNSRSTNPKRNWTHAHRKFALAISGLSSFIRQDTAFNTCSPRQSASRSQAGWSLASWKARIRYHRGQCFTQLLRGTPSASSACALRFWRDRKKFISEYSPNGRLAKNLYMCRGTNARMRCRISRTAAPREHKCAALVVEMYADQLLEF